jgi:hypothetical protein
VVSAIGCVVFASGTILTLTLIGPRGTGYAGDLLPGHLPVGIGIALPTIRAGPSRGRVDGHSKNFRPQPVLLVAPGTLARV